MEAISISLNTISERGVYTHTSLAYPAICQSRKDPGIRVSKHDSHPSLSEHPQVLESIFPLSFTQQGTCSQPYPPTHIRAPGATIRAPLPASSHNTIDLCRGFLLLLPSPPHISHASMPPPFRALCSQVSAVDGLGPPGPLPGSPGPASVLPPAASSSSNYTPVT